jgi:hypothetical protein
MHLPRTTAASPARPAPLQQRAARARRIRLALAGVVLAGCGSSHAIDFGPFSLTGFGKYELTRVNKYCDACGVNPDENKQRAWADPLVYGHAYGPATLNVLLAQPYLGVKFDLPMGFKVAGLLSQRWRDGKPDIPGFLYDRSIALSHEDYGSLRYGAMTTRSWSVADYPYGTNVGVSDAWGASGAGYGLLTHAVRYTSRVLDVFEGDLVLEATYDSGNTGFKKNKPRFVELYGQYHKGDLVVDAMVQDTRNGTPSSWGHGPFTGLTPFPDDDLKLGGSGQSIAMAMGRYQIDSRFEVSGGVRANRWSGAYARITTSTPGQPDQWNNMFNVDWGCAVAVPVRCNTGNPGYPARSVDGMLGLRWRFAGQWVASTGMVYLGRAKTDNPSDRGGTNTALVNTLGLNYDFGNGLQLYGLAGHVRYGHLGLSPMSMPGNASFTNIDSRVSTTGNWFGAGAVFVF